MRSLGHERLSRGLCPQTPGIYRFAARMRALGGGAGRLRPFRRLRRRSGCVPAEPYPPLSYFQSGSHQPRRARRLQRTATTPLTACLGIGVYFTRPTRLRPSRGSETWSGVAYARRSDLAGPSCAAHGAGDACRPELPEQVLSIDVWKRGDRLPAIRGGRLICLRIIQSAN